MKLTTALEILTCIAVTAFGVALGFMLSGCSTDLPEAGPQARDCLKAGYERDGLVKWRCADGRYYWIPDRRSHK